jgi:hypothetical protein
VARRAERGGEGDEDDLLQSNVGGEATVLLVGLAVILALLFGAPSVALGADGKSLILGRGT